MDILFFTGTVAGCSAALGFLLNFLVILVRVIKRPTMTTFQLLLTTIAFNDMVLSLLFAFMAALMLNGFNWIYHPSACKVLFPTITVFMSVNVGCMFVVSYERYRAIVHPFQPRFSTKRNVLFIVIIWIISVGTVVPNIIALRMQSYGQCRESWGDETTPKIYSLCLIVLVYVLPLSSITIMHILIALKLRRAGNLFDAHRRGGCNFLQHKLQRNVRTVRLLVSITIAFSLFVLPTKLYYLIWDFAPDLATGKVADILDGYKSLNYIHVIINPILYSLTNLQFRKDLCDVLRCRTLNKLEQTSGIISRMNLDNSRRRQNRKMSEVGHFYLREIKRSSSNL